MDAAAAVQVQLLIAGRCAVHSPLSDMLAKSSSTPFSAFSLTVNSHLSFLAIASMQPHQLE